MTSSPPPRDVPIVTGVHGINAEPKEQVAPASTDAGQSVGHGKEARRPPKLGPDDKPLQGIEASKRLAAYAAVDAHILKETKLVGIGSGSTVPFVIDRIKQQGADWNNSRWFVPTGFQSKELIVQAGLKLGDVDQFPALDVTIDGADEVDNDLNCIKGGGGCHLREKVIAEAARDFIIVADSRKNGKVLGTSWKQGVPIEITPFAWAIVFRNIKSIGGEPNLRMGQMAKAGPIVTDNGNFIIDAKFGEESMRKPKELLQKIKHMTGVLEVGLFPGMAKAAYFGNPDGSVTIRNSDGTAENLRL